jgi:XTP/dITP diphosphohydrolase
VIRSAAELDLAEPEETGDSFAANAELKARAAADACGFVALADDSGLVIDALGGAPGIYSARWAGATRDFALAMLRIERELAQKAVTAARAKFVCALALAAPKSHCAIFEGEVKGQLRFPPKGDKGFGYDPIFVAEHMTQSFAEIDPALKHRISHRAMAFAKLIAALKMP